MINFFFKPPAMTSLTFPSTAKVDALLTVQREVADCATGKPYATSIIKYNTDI